MLLICIILELLQHKFKKINVRMRKYFYIDFTEMIVSFLDFDPYVYV